MEPLNALLLVVLFIFFVIVLVTILKTLFTVRTYTAGWSSAGANSTASCAPAFMS